MLQAPDTIFVRAPRGTLAVAADWALVLSALSLAILALLGVWLLFRTSIQVRRMGRAASTRVDPLLDRGKSVAANVEFITATLRTDVEGLHQSIRALSDRLKQASDHMEHRIEEFNALMEVVQGEAEDVFLDTASTARGVRAGAKRLVGPSDPGGSGVPARRESTDETAPDPDAPS